MTDRINMNSLNVDMLALPIPRRRKARIPLKSRRLPRYTNGEEIFNTVTHIVGGALGIATLVLCVVIAAMKGSVSGIVCGAVFGFSMTVLYTMSSIYHGLRTFTSKLVFQIIDHCTIYFLIAGTYTPFLVCALAKEHPVAAYLTFAVVWGTAIVAMVLNAIDLAKFKTFSMIAYVVVGWAILPSVHLMFSAIGPHGFFLLLGGGVIYTLGIIFYALGSRVRYFHSIFHIFVLLGSVAHALCVMFYVI